MAPTSVRDNLSVEYTVGSYPPQEPANPGDYHTDTSTFALFGRTLREWQRWNPHGEEVEHPFDDTRVLWCNGQTMGWFSREKAKFSVSRRATTLSSEEQIKAALNTGFSTPSNRSIVKRKSTQLEPTASAKKARIDTPSISAAASISTHDIPDSSDITASSLPPKTRMKAQNVVASSGRSSPAPATPIAPPPPAAPKVVDKTLTFKALQSIFGSAKPKRGNSDDSPSAVSIPAVPPTASTSKAEGTIAHLRASIVVGQYSSPMPRPPPPPPPSVEAPTDHTTASMPTPPPESMQTSDTVVEEEDEEGGGGDESDATEVDLAALALSNRVRDLERLVEARDAKLAEVEDKLSRAQLRLITAGAAASFSTATVGDASSVDELKRKLTVTETKLRTTLMLAKEESRARVAAEKRLEDAEAESARLRTASKGKGKERAVEGIVDVEELERQQMDLDRRLRELEQQREEIERQRSQLDSSHAIELADVQSRLSSLTTTHESLLAQFTQLTTDKTALTNTNGDLQSMNTHLIGETSTLREKITMLEETVAHSSKWRLRAVEERDRALKELDEATRERNSIVTEGNGSAWQGYGDAYA